MSKQLLFPWPMMTTRISPEGVEERVRYGQYESVLIVKENGLPVDRVRTLLVPRYPVTEVELQDGSRLLFDEPWYMIEQGPV